MERMRTFKYKSVELIRELSRTSRSFMPFKVAVRPPHSQRPVQRNVQALGASMSLYPEAKWDISPYRCPRGKQAGRTAHRSDSTECLRAVTKILSAVGPPSRIATDALRIHVRDGTSLEALDTKVPESVFQDQGRGADVPSAVARRRAIKCGGSAINPLCCVRPDGNTAAFVIPGGLAFVPRAKRDTSGASVVHVDRGRSCMNDALA